MRLKIAFLFSLIIMLFVIGLAQVGSLFYFEDGAFSSQIEKQLVSSVQIKGERINDYFLERSRDANFIVSSKDVSVLIEGRGGYSGVVEDNAKIRLKRIAGQVKVFMGKYPDFDLVRLREDEDFKNIVLKKIGDRSRFVLVDINSNKIVLDSFSKNIGKDLIELGGRSEIFDVGVKSEDGVSLGVAYVIYENEFKVVLNRSKFLERFIDIGKYSDLVLIDENGFVVYDSGMEVGLNLMYDFNLKSDLGKIYFLTKESGKGIIYGPYMREGVDGFDMVLAFSSLNEKGDVVVLYDNMDFVNSIVGEGIDLGNSGEAYLINGDSILISSLNGVGDGLMVQKVLSESSKKCFERKGDLKDFSDVVSLSYGIKGGETLGTYAYIDKPGWCLISEVDSKEVFDLPKMGKISKDIWFIGLFNFVLLIFGFWFVRRRFE